MTDQTSPLINSEILSLCNRKGQTVRCLIGPLQDPVTWYGINYAGTQVTQWDFHNKAKSGWSGTSSFVLKVPLCNLRPSVINSVPCDRILQRAYNSELLLLYSRKDKNFAV